MIGLFSEFYVDVNQLFTPIWARESGGLPSTNIRWEGFTEGRDLCVRLIHVLHHIDIPYEITRKYEFIWKWWNIICLLGCDYAGHIQWNS